jgi:hypothetical protein
MCVKKSQVYEYVYIYTYIQIYTYINTHVNINMCIHMSICIRLNKMPSNTRTIRSMPICIHIYIYTYIFTYIFTYIYIYIHIYIYTYEFIYIYIYIQTVYLKIPSNTRTIRSMPIVRHLIAVRDDIELTAVVTLQFICTPNKKNVN